MTPAELFHRAGVALFGDEYVAPLAKALGIERSTVLKMRNGVSRITPGVWRDLLAHMSLARSRIEATEQAIRDALGVALYD